MNEFDIEELDDGDDQIDLHYIQQDLVDLPEYGDD